MNMISTGAFLNEMDASTQQPSVAEKFAAVWEKKNAKAARAGGVSLMALSLAACGSSSGDTTASTDTSTDTTTTTATPSSFDLTPLTDIASKTMALNGSLSSEFRFTDGNETVNAMTATIVAGDTLLDASGTDADVMNITVTGDMAKMSAVDIETVNVTFASGSDASARMSNFSGMDTLNVTGSVAGVVEDAGKATIAVADYGRTLTVDVDSLAGSTTAGNPDEMNLSVSGGTYGTTASTQTTLALTVQGAGNATDGVLETLNIESTGSAANVFALTTDADMTLSKINFTGDQAATVRVAEGDVSGNTIAVTSTGATRLSLDANSTGATPLNAANWTGLDAIEIRDSATASATDAVRINSAADGTKLVLKNSVGTTELSVQGASRTVQKDSVSLELNGSSTTAGVTVGQFGSADYGQNIATLNVASLGLASSTSTTPANTITDLIGDYTTVNITGDTSLDISTLNIEATQTASSTSARSVTVDASGMTGNAYVKLDAGDNTKVTYTLIGTDGNDTLAANTTGSTLTGNAGNDVLSGDIGDDTISGGDGKDHINSSSGEDTITLGAGADTIDMNHLDVAAGQEVQLITVSKSTTIGGAGTVVFNILGEDLGFTFDTSAAANNTTDELDDLIAAQINLMDGAAAGNFSASASSSVVTVTFKTSLGNVDAITARTLGETAAADETRAESFGTTNTVTFTSSDSAGGTTAADVDMTITDFAAGDIIDVDAYISDMIGSAVSYFEGAAADMATGTGNATQNVLVLTGASYASAELAEDAYTGEFAASNNDVIIAFLNSTTGQAEIVYDADADTDGGGAANIITLENITSLTELAGAFSADTFVI